MAMNWQAAARSLVFGLILSGVSACYNLAAACSGAASEGGSPAELDIFGTNPVVGTFVRAERVGNDDMYVNLIFEVEDTSAATKKLILKRPALVDLFPGQLRGEERRHLDPAFWLGLSSNSFVNGSCKIGHYFVEDQKYLLIPEKLDLQFSAEPVTVAISDAWYQHVMAKVATGRRLVGRANILRMFDYSFELDCRYDTPVSNGSVSKAIASKARGEVAKLCKNLVQNRMHVYADERNPDNIEVIIAFPILDSLGTVDRDVFGGVGAAYNELP
jgi:hypothetical protein